MCNTVFNFIQILSKLSCIHQMLFSSVGNLLSAQLALISEKRKPRRAIWAEGEKSRSFCQKWKL